MSCFKRHGSPVQVQRPLIRVQQPLLRGRWLFMRGQEPLVRAMSFPAAGRMLSFLLFVLSPFLLPVALSVMLPVSGCSGRTGKEQQASAIIPPVPAEEIPCRQDTTFANIDPAAVRVAAGLKYVNTAARPCTAVLPDGSRVVITPHTAITLSGQFGRGKRDVLLDGEAIFDVKADAGRPFILYTKNLLIEVDGARFHADAFQHNAGEQVDLFSGRLKVKKTYHSDTDNEPEVLNAGEMVMINRDIDLMEKEKMDSAELSKFRGIL